MEPKKEFPIPKTVSKLPGLPLDDVSDVRTRIEKQRTKLISRLNTAEKLLASMDGQLFAGDDQELMLRLLQDLKRKIQTTNKLSTKSSLFEDFIYKTANLLQANNKPKAASFFKKIAQEASQGMDLPPGLDLPVTPSSGSSESTGSDQDKTETYGFLQEFFNNLTRGQNSASDKERDEKKKQEQDERINNTFKQKASYENDDEIVVYAQEDISFPTGTKTNPIPKHSQDGLSDTIESALNNVTIQDIIRELEIITSVLNQREIPNKMSYVDIALNKLNLSAYFPQIGEAMGKINESTTYVSTRLETVATKLKGSLHFSGAKEMTTPQQITPGTEGIHQSLQEQENKEESRKQKDLEPKVQPVGQMAPELQEPARIEQSKPIPVR